MHSDFCSNVVTYLSAAPQRVYNMSELGELALLKFVVEQLRFFSEHQSFKSNFPVHAHGYFSKTSHILIIGMSLGELYI